MAYDPEAREAGNSAMIIGIIVLVLLVGGALAYFATRPGDVPGPDVIVDQNPPSSTTIIEGDQPAPAPVPDNDTPIIQPPASSTETNTTITSEKTTTEAPAADAPAGDAPPADAPPADAPPADAPASP